MSATDDFIQAIEAHTGRRGRRRSRETRLLCPGHPDHDPSLDVREGSDGRPLVQCRSHGCSFEEICRAIGRDPADFLPARDGGDGILATYDYVDERGVMLFQVVRKANKQFSQRRPDGTGGWIWKLDGTRRVPYRLPRVLEAAADGQRLYIAEGEKDVETLEVAGVVATCNPGGAGKWRDAYAMFLRGISEVVIVADRDEAGIEHAISVAASVRRVVDAVQIVQAREGKDATDHLRAGLGVEDFSPFRGRREPKDLSDLTVDEILAAKPDITKDELLAENPFLKALLGSKSSPASEVARLIRESGAVLFHDAAGRGFATFENGEHTETWPIASQAFKLFARLLYFRATKESPSGQALKDGLATIESEAIFDGAEAEVWLRVAGEQGAIYIDLGDPDWKAIAITSTGWSVVDEHPVRFRRARGMLALPEPQRGGDLAELRRFLNVGSDDDWRLAVGWLHGAARPPGWPYTIAVFHGEQGSAKSSGARVLRDLLDPNTVPLRAAPRELRDLMISASNSWVVSFDNLSHLQQWLSDGLCRLSTGGGFATRELYENDAEILLEAQRPVILNGIEEIATRSDLLDRCLLFNLPTIPKSERRSEADFWRDFYDARPRILGALCDALATALKNIDSTSLEQLPRMADFALWATAAEPALGWPHGAFLASYDGNRGQGHELALEASIISAPLLELAEQGFAGTATELLVLLNGKVEERVTKQQQWPKTARALSGMIKRLAPNLRALGYEVQHGQRDSSPARRRLITIGRP
jgi:hypothetical protein